MTELCEGSIATCVDGLVIRVDYESHDGWYHGDIVKLTEFHERSGMRVGGRIHFHINNVASVVRPSGIMLL